jgi:predicted permease
VRANVRLTLVVRWSYGYRHLLAPSKPETAESDPSEDTPLTKPSDEEGDRADYASTEASTSTFKPSSHLRPDLRTIRSISRESFTSFSVLNLSASDPDSDSVPTRVKAILSHFRGIMNPPLWAILASVVIALITPLQQQLFLNAESFLHNSVFLALDTAGSAAIPTILMLLGATLVKSEEVIVHTPNVPPEIDPKMENRGIFLAIFCRMVLVPLLMAPFLIAVMHFGITYDPAFSHLNTDATVDVMSGCCLIPFSGLLHF